MMFWGWNSGWMIGGMIFMVIFWAVVIWLIVWGIRRSAQSNDNSTKMSNKTPLDIAKERYSKGEITLEQFEEIKKRL